MTDTEKSGGRVSEAEFYHPAQNWRGACGRGPSIEHPVGGRCVACDEVTKWKALALKAKEALNNIAYVKTQCFCGEDSKGNETPQCAHCYAKEALALFPADTRCELPEEK